MLPDRASAEALEDLFWSVELDLEELPDLLEDAHDVPDLVASHPVITGWPDWLRAFQQLRQSYVAGGMTPFQVLRYQRLTALIWETAAAMDALGLQRPHLPEPIRDLSPIDRRAVEVYVEADRVYRLEEAAQRFAGGFPGDWGVEGR